MAVGSENLCPYDGNPRCPKCGLRPSVVSGTNITHKSASPARKKTWFRKGYKGFPEHMRWKCVFCGYILYMKPYTEAPKHG